MYAQSKDIYAKYDIRRNPLLVFLNKFSITAASGFGGTYYRHDLDGFFFAQDPNNQFISSTSNTGTTFQGFRSWLGGNDFSPGTLNTDDIFDGPYTFVPNPVNNPNLERTVFGPIDADSAGLSFAGLAPTVPFMFSIHYNIFKFRIGAGFQYERHYMRPLRPSIMRDVIRPYQPEFEKTGYTKFFGMVGYQFYEWWNYTFALELQLGSARPGKEINTNAIGIGQNFFTNLGINIEHNLSEYVRVIVKPSLDFKSYTINIPDDQLSSIKHNNAAFLVQVGLSINIPEIPRSPVKSDHIQLKHVIMDPKSGRLMEVRGQPMWKVQNPKVGQNHRKLWRYKWKNKGKLDPY